MKYYDESRMKDVRQALETSLETWDGVSHRTMFGCPSFTAHNELFALLVTDGLVLTRITEESRTSISERFVTGSFRAGSRVIEKWLRVEIQDSRDIETLLPYVRKSYEMISAEGKA